MHDEDSPASPSFLHLLAHDLRTPLGGLSAALDVLSYGSQLTPEDVSEALSIAKRQVVRLSQSIDILQILDLLDRPAIEPATLRFDLLVLKAWDRSRLDNALLPRPLELPPCLVKSDSEPLLQLLHALLPRVAQIAMNTSFRMFPDSSASKGEKGGKPALSPEAIAMQQMMRGIHF